MVKHLQDVVARLEAERRTPEPSACSEALLKEKELKIKEVKLMDVKFENFFLLNAQTIFRIISSATQRISRLMGPSYTLLTGDKQMEMEMEDLKRQRDLAQARLDELQRKLSADQMVRE